MKVGDLVVLCPSTIGCGWEAAILLHIHEVDMNEDQNQRSDRCDGADQLASVLCNDGVWTVPLDDLEVINESR